MLVHVQLGQGADIDLKPAFCRKGIAELIIEAVDPLDDEHIVLSQL